MAASTITGSRKRVLWVLGFVLWGAALAAGFHEAMSWEFRPGQGAQNVAAHVAPLKKPKLIVALHSQCPCSRATVENLASLKPGERSKLSILFVFTGPDAEKSETLKKASAIPGSRFEFLSESEILRRYGAKTSGQALLYDASGKLVFSGGLTESRGTPGDRAEGMNAIRQVIAGHECRRTAPVYGCALQTPG